MPKDNSIQSVLIIGSGPIIIGQACEFDYSGSQAARSLREEGIKVILINSNPATIMTDPMMADKVYLLPLTVESIEQILEENQIDAVLPTMGGQTALNLCKEADELGVWQKNNVRLIGVDVEDFGRAARAPQHRDQLVVEIGILVDHGHRSRRIRRAASRLRHRRSSSCHSARSRRGRSSLRAAPDRRRRSSRHSR